MPVHDRHIRKRAYADRVYRTENVFKYISLFIIYDTHLFAIFICHLYPCT